MPLLQATLLCLHLLAATFWIGGMATMHFAVRPAAVATLEPPARLGFMAVALGRFFAGVEIAILVLLGTGVAMIFAAGGFAHLHWSVHVMLVVGLVMMALFGHIRRGVYPKLQRAVGAKEWPVAGALLNGIRQLVSINLALGVLIVVAVLIGRAS